MKPYRGIQKASNIFEKLMHASFKRYGFANQKIAAEWHYIIGNHLAQFTLPQKIIFPANQTRGGVLYIAISNPGLSLEIQAQERFIISKISTFFGYQAVSRIKVLIDKSIYKQMKADDICSKTKINKSDLRKIQKELASIEDKELHAQLTALADSIFQTE
jgi:hypothetical protein